MRIVGTISLFAIVACSLALPQQYGGGAAQGRQLQSGGSFGFDNGRQYEIIPIIRDDRYGPIDGHYTFDFETGDGLIRREEGNPSAPNGAVVSQGDWRFTFPDGTPAQFSFIADELGYRVESPLIHPLPAHAIEQIERSARERAAGIFHDGQYDPARYGGGQWDPIRHGGGHYNPGQYRGASSQQVSRTSNQQRGRDYYEN